MFVEQVFVGAWVVLADLGNDFQRFFPDHGAGSGSKGASAGKVKTGGFIGIENKVTGERADQQKARRMRKLRHVSKVVLRLGMHG